MVSSVFLSLAGISGDWQDLCYNLIIMAKRRRIRKKKIRYSRVLILVLLALAAGNLVRIVLTELARPAETPAPTPTPDPRYPNDYNWECLTADGQYKSYNDDTYTSLQGIDVSYAQGEIDWAAVRNDGIEFAMIRTGYRGYETGLLHEDTRFRANMDGAVQNGLQVGVYWFAQEVSVEEAREAAYYNIQLLQGYRLDLPVAYDMETVTDHDRMGTLTKEEKTAVAKEFCSVLHEAGFHVMIYASDSWLRDEIYMEELQDLCGFWMAHYNVEHPSFPFVFSMWQYSRAGQVAGIPEPVDLDLLIRKR